MDDPVGRRLTGDRPLVTLVAYWTINAIETVFCLLTYINRRDYTNLQVARGRTIAIIPA